MSTPERALIIGCGYLGRRIGRRLLDSGYAVRGTSRSAERALVLSHAGIEGAVLELGEAAGRAVLGAECAVVVYAAAPGRAPAGAEVVYGRGLAASIEAWRERPPGRFILLSSTGVYAQDDGAWVDETSPARPSGERAQVLLEGEKLVLDAARQHGFPGLVLRLGGLYGPGRSPLEWCGDPGWRRRLGRGNREAYMNWVHADDAAAATVLAARSGRPGEIYLVVDDEPVRRGDFYDFACDQTGAPRLELPRHAFRLAKRCSNRKARGELGFAPVYPSYREGLAALAAPG